MSAIVPQRIQRDDSRDVSDIRPTRSQLDAILLSTHCSLSSSRPFPYLCVFTIACPDRLDC